jgi:hypothetical protein
MDTAKRGETSRTQLDLSICRNTTFQIRLVIVMPDKAMDIETEELLLACDVCGLEENEDDVDETWTTFIKTLAESGGRRCRFT